MHSTFALARGNHIRVRGVAEECTGFELSCSGAGDGISAPVLSHTAQIADSP